MEDKAVVTLATPPKPKRQKRNTVYSQPDWMPSPRHIRYAQEYVKAASGSEANPTIGSIAKSMGIAESTIYRWYYVREFKEWFRERISTFLDADLPAIWTTLAKEARTGNINAIKLHLERHDPDYIPSQKHMLVRDKSVPEFNDAALVEELKNFIKAHPEILSQLVPQTIEAKAVEVQVEDIGNEVVHQD